MGRFLSAFADRMVTAVVPKTTAGACPCNDCYWTPCGSLCMRCCTNCNCTSTTCGPCNGNPANC